MEILFQTQTIKYLAEKRVDDLRQEQTGEITIPESMPELGRVVDCFGTVLVQSRTVENGSVSVSGGIALGVLYVPASGEGLERVQLNLPFTVTRKLPTQADTRLFYWGWLRSAEARFVNARKLLVRAELCSEFTLLTPAELELKQIGERPRGLVCKTETYPMRLPLCAAEKEVRIADEVLMPEDAPGLDRLLKACCGVAIGERRVLGDRAVFQGELELRVLGLNEEGKPVAWNGKVPFSQYAELDRSLEEDAHLSIQPILEHMEIDTDGQPDSRRLLINVSFLVQMILWGDIPVRLTQDAYALRGEFAPQWQSCDLSPCLDAFETELTQTAELPADAAGLLDWTLFKDRFSAPQGAQTAGAELGINLLYYDAEGGVKNQMQRRPLELRRKAAPDAEWRVRFLSGGSAVAKPDQLALQLRVEERYCQSSALRNLSGGTLQPAETGDGPSLIVTRTAGELWEIAKRNGSTVRAIRAANGLEDKVLTEERLLLIPSGRGAAEAEEETE